MLAVRRIAQRAVAASRCGGARMFGAKKDESIFDGALTVTPLDENEVHQRTRVSRIADEMTQRQEVCLASYTSFGFRLHDATFLCGPIAVFPKIALSWMVSSQHDITEESLELFVLLEPKLDIVIIGVGAAEHVDPVRRRIAPFLRRHKINFEILATEHAMPVYNYLVAEGRYVGAALFPPVYVHVTQQRRIETAMLHDDPYDGHFNLWDQVPWPTKIHQEEYDLIETLWTSEPDTKKLQAKQEEKRRLTALGKSDSAEAPKSLEGKK